MKKLLSLPTNLVECFHDIMKTDREEWFCTADPKGKKLGSGGGTAWLLNECRKNDNDGMDLEQWIAKEKRILLHAGGQSRRLPAYAPSGKILTPIPVFRWARGQKLNQNLLDLQLPLYENIMEKAPEALIKIMGYSLHQDKNRKCRNECYENAKMLWSKAEKLSADGYRNLPT